MVPERPQLCYVYRSCPRPCRYDVDDDGTRSYGHSCLSHPSHPSHRTLSGGSRLALFFPEWADLTNLEIPSDQSNSLRVRSFESQLPPSPLRPRRARLRAGGVSAPASNARGRDSSPRTTQHRGAHKQHMGLRLTLLVLAHPAVHAAPRTRLQDACGCEHCVSQGNTVADCESFGSDCGCYHGCPCATCVAKGNSVADCVSFGSDCACYNGNSGASGGACANFDERTLALNDECCDEVTEDCSSGRPAVCNVACAHVLLPYFDDCAGALGADGVAAFSDVVALCHAAETVRSAATLKLSPLVPSGTHIQHTHTHTHTHTPALRRRRRHPRFQTASPQAT